MSLCFVSFSFRIHYYIKGAKNVFLKCIIVRSSGAQWTITKYDVIFALFKKIQILF